MTNSKQNESRNHILIVDLDGTVVDSPVQKLPTARLKSAFANAQQKYKISAATGRPWTFAKDIISDLGLTEPSIVAGGTQIRASDGSVLWQSNIDRNDLVAIVGIVSSIPNHSILINEYEESDYLEDKGISVQEINLDIDIHFLELIYLTNNEATAIKEKIDNLPNVTATIVTAQREGLKDLHVTNQFATKEHAIAEVLKLTQVDVDQTTGIGDGHNDLHLFAAVKNKIAMGNAAEELIAASDRVIGNVQDDGLADYLDEISTSLK
ncbi:MAG: Cof subfamily protein (haloacid dehalogenase superfamily) [Candidatus Saccharimonadales bacterium]|jgi:Cof subfamily protein (haloacid dehalogenase superfamily)